MENAICLNVISKSKMGESLLLTVEAEAEKPWSRKMQEPARGVDSNSNLSSNDTLKLNK
jgi:hypothetical protein